MNNDRKISLIINLFTVFIMLLVILIALYIYRDSVYNFFGRKNPTESEPTEGTPENSTENSTDLINFTDPTDFTDFTDFTELIDPKNPEGEDILNPTGNTGTPKSDLMRHMFENAIEIPGSQGKIEPPPDGRSEETQYGAVPLSETIPEPFEYFKSSVFLGDSVTSGFDLYKTKIKFNDETVLDEVNVVAAKKYGVYYALQEISEESSHPLMNGKQTLPEDIIAEKDVKNIFICLGLNDLTFEKISDFIKYYSRLIDRIKTKSPDKNIVIMSVTPLVSGQHQYDLDNSVIIEANNALLEFAKENNIYFIDYAAAIRDSRNCLPDDLSSDGYCHLTVPAYDMLVEYLLYHPIK